MCSQNSKTSVSWSLIEIDIVVMRPYSQFIILRIVVHALDPLFRVLDLMNDLVKVRASLKRHFSYSHNSVIISYS